jgi:hypothetical protein
VLAAALALALASGPARAVAPARIREQVAQILKDDAFQATLPREPPTDAFHLPLGPLELLLRILLFAALAVLVVLLATWLARRLGRGVADVAVDGAPAAGAPVQIPIASARALAAEGRYGEAIHALLLETLEALSRAARLAPSLTSREILARVRLPVRARDALAGLVVAVEVSRFGGAEPGEPDYLACLDRFEAFLASYRGTA